MSNVDLISRRARSACERLSDLYQLANSAPAPSPELLPTALKELGIVSEALQIAVAELERQDSRFEILQNDLETERQRYQDFFEFIPNACVITNSNFIIQEANYAGASLLNWQPQQLLGKPLTNFIFPEDLPLFEAKFSPSAQQNHLELSIRLHRHPAHFFHAALTANVVRKPDGQVQYLQWLLNDITERKRAEDALDNPDYDPCQDRPLFHFNKGETIPFERQAIWLVAEGVVKLTTLSERGEETLVGLVGDAMVFGSHLTALQTYQATAVSDVKLALIPLSEVFQSPQLAQTLLSSLTQRLQQTESLLAIYGQIRVEERLNSLLMLLKQAIGQPIEQGIRLRARLTHQDFASACCTTRVTVTRLLGKLQEQGKIVQDAHNHLVLKD